MNLINKNFIILLTGCINPNGMCKTLLLDTKVREEQYYKAIDYYLNNTKLRIVFCENSNHTSFANYFKQYQKCGRYEYITFNGNNYNKNLGKGFGEALIINHAINHSKIINSNTFIIVKITGRIIIKNIKTLLFLFNRTDHIYVRFGTQKKFIHSRFIIAPTYFFKDFFIPNSHKLNDSNGYYFEHLLYDACLEWKLNKKRITDIPLAIKYSGIDGTSGEVIKRPKFPHIRSILIYIYRKWK